MAAANGVLYVEDEQTNRSLMVAIFEGHFESLKLTVVRSGADALSAVAHVVPRLILLDGQLGDMAAPELVSELRTRLKASLPPIVVISGSIPIHDIPGVVAHVTKPYNIPDLIALIAQLTGTDDQRV